MSGQPKTSGVFNSNLELKIQTHGCLLYFPKLFSLISTVPLNLLIKVKKSAYLTLTPLILISEVSEKVKISIMLKLYFESKIQKQHSHLRFMSTILFNINNAFKFTP